MRTGTARHTQRGYTLAELMFVLVVLALVAAITVPPGAERSAQRLRRAAQEVAGAFDFARSESLRTGVPHGVRVQNARRIAVFRLDRTKSPPAERYDVYHPIDKSLYDVDLAGGIYTQGTTLTGYFLFQGVGSADTAATFDVHGEAVRGDDARPLATGGILLANETSTLAVAVAPLTGRTTTGTVTGTVANPANAFPAPVQP